MRRLVCCIMLTFAGAFAQSTPDNAATEALKRRILGLNLLNSPSVQKPGSQPVILSGPVTPQICTIPLLEVRPPGTKDKMPAVQPPQSVLRNRGNYVRVPAPACGQGASTNQK
jgi:hypothetical protein